MSNVCFTRVKLSVTIVQILLSNSYTMGCLHIHGGTPRALASGLPYVQVTNMVCLLYTTYISVDLAHHGIVRAKVGINHQIRFLILAIDAFTWNKWILVVNPITVDSYGFLFNCKTVGQAGFNPLVGA